MEQKNLIGKTGKRTAEAYLYGVIGADRDVDLNRLVQEMETLRRQGVDAFTFYVNSDGGEVVQGIALFNYLERTDVSVTWVIDGIAASMMALLLSSPRHRVKAAAHAKLMYHSVKGFVYGDCEKILSTAEMVRTFEASLVEIMSRRTGLPEGEVRERFFGSDYWLSAQEAMLCGLVDEVLPGNGAVEVPDLSVLSNSREVYQFYHKQIKSQKMAKESNVYALALGLPETEDESRVVASLQETVAQNKSLTSSLTAEREKTARLEERLRALEKGRAESLVDTAIAGKKIGADERETYLALAEKDFAAVEKILGKMQGATRIAAQLNTQGAAGKYEGKTWDELDRSGLLASLKAEAPEVYEKMYEEKFKK
jgi:ATP-dependent protease ClpP protease subunit